MFHTSLSLSLSLSLPLSHSLTHSLSDAYRCYTLSNQPFEEPYDLSYPSKSSDFVSI